MRGVRYNRILTGTALALVLAAPSLTQASPESPVAIEAAVPMPDPATLPPPTAADVKSAPAAAPEAPSAPAAAAPVSAPSAPAAAAPTAAPETPSAAAPAAAPSAPSAAAPAAPPAATTGSIEGAAPQTASAPATETVKPDPLASLDPADRPIAEKIRDMLAAKTDKIFANKKERAAVEAFYQNRNLAPLWLDKGVQNERAKAAIARVKGAAADGLDPSDYKIPDFTAAQNPDALAEAELKLTGAVLTYARHVQAGRFSYTAISRNSIELPQQPPDTAAVLTSVADAKDASIALDAFSPPQPEYKALKAKLAEMRGKTGQAGSQIAEGPALKLAKTPTEDSRVPQLRARLGVSGDAADLRYDSALAEAVKKFQRGHELKATGVLDAATVRELNGPPHDRQIDTILANMERWRWVPRDLGKIHVVVNLPDYSLRVFDQGKVLWTTRIVIGKPSMQTPLLSETMKYITVNPTWNVPPSIVQNEYLPALAQDPTALERIGLRLTHNPDGSVHIYQPPGDGNALGRLRFNFPNRFLVYQHDTPDKHLFKEERRAFSHGCMRVQDPARYAEVLLSLTRPNDNYTQERIKRMFGKEEQDIQLPTHVPVHLTYQTAFVDEDGKLNFRADVYGLDAKVIAAIKSERSVIEVAQERRREDSDGSASGSRRHTRQQARQQQVVPQRSTLSFFEQVFGGGAPSRPPAPVIRYR